jgi:type II secretory pathway predicted ATPase ExeA
MYLEHFGLSEPPFRITPHTDFFFAGANRGATLDALIYSITHDEGIVKVSGEVGSGKTMLCRVLLERLPEHVTTIYLANPSLSREDILYAIADELRLEVAENARASIVLRALQDHLIRSYGEGRQVVVLIDEAHAMPIETLEEIRLLSNLESNRSKLLQLVLFGQPELNGILARPDMRQLKERITHNFMLEPLVRDDIASYLEFRMRAAGYKGPSLFTPPAIKTIAKSSLGLTRRVNILADKALLAAFSVGGHQIGVKEAQAAIKDCDFSDSAYAPERKLSRKILASTLAGFLVVGGVIAIGMNHSRNTALLAENTHPPAVTAPLANAATPSPKPANEPEQSAVAPVLTMPVQTIARSQSPAAPPAQRPADLLASAANRLSPTSRKHLDSGANWISQAASDRWFLQLYAVSADSPQAVDAFLQRATSSDVDRGKIHVYLSDLSGHARFGVIYGDYENADVAKAAARQLPAHLRANRPFPRQVSKLR